MDKKLLKQIIETLTPHTTINVNFVGNVGGSSPGADKGSPRTKGSSGEYLVLNTKRGRGKRGSQYAILKDSEDNKVEIGTPFNGEILNITVNGKMYGLSSELELPVEFEKVTDFDAAARLKENCKKFIGKENVEVLVDSEVENIKGVFTLLEAKLNVGRFGQISLRLRRKDGYEWILKTHAHAEKVKSVTLV
jgi:hypothetical protein